MAHNHQSMNTYLESVSKRFRDARKLAEKTFEQVNDEALYWQYNSESNSIAVIVQHLAGNMISRWTDFFTTDGEKPDRDRDSEFETQAITRPELMARWDKGWQCLHDSLQSVTEDDLDKTVYIRGEAHTAIDAINRQLGHIAYHVGQIVYLGKMIAGEQWQSLSVPRGQSAAFNAKMAAKQQQ
jgi:hypothetical protein